MEEIWKDVPGYEGVYQISNQGNFRAVRKRRIITYEDIIVPVDTYEMKGYKYIRLYSNGLKRNYSVKKLMEQCFGENSEK